MTDYEALSRAYDIYQIKNVMGHHAYHHALGTHRQELDEIWSAREDISWGNNMGFWVGRDTMYAYYADAKAVQDEATLKLMAKANPKIEVRPENFQMGALLMHSLTTPLIQVADDGKTAQGMWYSLGQVTNAGPMDPLRVPGCTSATPWISSRKTMHGRSGTSSWAPIWAALPESPTPSGSPSPVLKTQSRIP